MKKFFKNPLKSALILLFFSFCLAAITRLIPRDENKNPSERIKIAGEKLVYLREEALATLEKISHFEKEKDFNNFFLKAGQEKTGFSYFVLQNNKLQYWSDNEPAISDSMLMEINDDDFLHLSNGDFLAYTVSAYGRKNIALVLIKHSYEYENKYLINGFNPALGLGEDLRVSTAGDTLYLPGNRPAYILKHNAGIYHPPTILNSWLYFIIFVLLLFAIYLFIKHFSKSFILIFSFTLIIIGLRTLMIYLKLPLTLYKSGIFSPAFYASSFYFNSLGDMLINTALFLVFSICLYESSPLFKKYKPALFILWISSAPAIHFLIRGLVINSKISFELSSPSDITIYSILAFTSISILLLCFLLLTAALLKNISSSKITGRRIWMGISICAVYIAVALTGMNREKEHEMRKLIAQKAEMRQDHVAEYYFRDQEDKIASDPYVLKVIHSASNINDKLTSYIDQKYFYGYLSKFDLNVQAFDEKNPLDSDITLDYYRRESQNGKTTYSQNLFFLNNETSGTSYLSILPLKEPGHKHTLVLLLTAHFLHSAKGFPELFMGGGNQDNPPSDEYSIARYSGQSLIYEYGNYIYPLSGKDFLQSRAEFNFIFINGYSHLIHRINDKSFIVVSKPKGNVLGDLTLFSWMFTFMTVLAFIIIILSGILNNENTLQWNLTRRVQASVIFLVVLSFLLVGFGTVYYINTKYITDQKKSISDQVNALWFMVNENLFSSNDTVNFNTPEQQRKLDLLVSNTNIDFNIFGGEGQKIYSSQPKIFDEGIISERMNPEAFINIKEKGLTQYIHPENAGFLKYIAAYAPFTDRNGKIIAFINLPYFEKQNELNKEVSAFLSALVNIYVLLFALAVFVTIFISSRITKPLLLIQEKMSGIKLGALNEKIAYSENDEIGQLVHEYNRMIDELSVSAEKLARSERETAWREMAKQVAHEIKNPLTPMKLSVQHLSRAVKEKGFKDEALLDRITSTLIQQIDTLSNIATAFSNFAQMPQPVPVKTNLNELLLQVTQLYNEGVNIEIHKSEDMFVMADKDQLIGIFSNLLKNAFQSIPPGRQGKIDISLRRDSGFITIQITDNGIGIPEDQRDKIFIPNFTTKTSGMGLGLAIVRNIVEEVNGNIWFSSIYGSGSTFFVSLPEAK